MGFTFKDFFRKSGKASEQTHLKKFTTDIKTAEGVKQIKFNVEKATTEIRAERDAVTNKFNEFKFKPGLEKTQHLNNINNVFEAKETAASSYNEAVKKLNEATNRNEAAKLEKGEGAKELQTEAKKTLESAKNTLETAERAYDARNNKAAKLETLIDQLTAEQFESMTNAGGSIEQTLKDWENIEQKVGEGVKVEWDRDGKNISNFDNIIERNERDSSNERVFKRKF